MHYYEVYIASQRFHGAEPLTYASEAALDPGTVVSVPMQRQSVLGIVGKASPKPSFATKPIKAVISETPVPVQAIQLLRWLQLYYPAPLGFLTQLFLPATLLQKSRNPTTPSAARELVTLPRLTPEQQAAYEAIQANDHKTFLLHGDTGSGKTRVYLELATQALASQKSCLVLTPEIGLTPQLAKDFETSFPGRVTTVHSTLTPAERRNAWRAINEASEPMIVLGPRSALFSPLHNIGYIIIDEAHDSAYKQEQAPYYQATRVAAQLAHLHGAKLIMGTATPLIADYYALEAKQLPILRMTKPAKETSYDEVNMSVVDLKDRSHFSRSSWLSQDLLRAIETALREQTQSLVFLNRRGTARLVMCQNCGWQASCPRCDLPLTYHGDAHNLRCHSCGYTEAAPSICPECHSADIVFKSVGTKTLVDELQRLYPKARIQRFDSDTKKADRLEQHYETVRDGAIDILVGTQMLSKGLDLPKLSTVGVVVADTSLYFPDYTANERTYQMLNQVIGRVGRGHQAGTVIVQTYHPESPTIQYALEKNYRAFYEAELKEREQFHFPPFYHVLKLSIARAAQKTAMQNAELLAKSLLQAGLAIDVSSPMPAFTERLNNQYRWQIIVKARDRRQLTAVIPLLPSGWTYDLDPSNLL